MKAYLKALTAILIFAVLLTFFHTEAQARQQPDEFLIRTYSIGLAVECLEETMQRISNMPGIMLNSSMNIRTGVGNTERRVSNFDLNETMTALRGLGRITTSSSSSQNVFAVVMDTRADLAIQSEQYQRLTELLHDVDTLEHFNLVESRLVHVISDMEWLQGHLNHLEFETGTSRINIQLSLIPDEEEEEEEEEPGALARIGQAFGRSAVFTLNVFQEILLVFAYISIPLGLVVIFGSIMLMVILKLTKKRRQSKRQSKAQQALKERNDNSDDETDGIDEVNNEHKKENNNEETNTDNSGA